MVGRHEQQDFVATAALDPGGGKRRSGRRVAARWLQQDGLDRGSYLFKLAHDEEALLLAADDEGRREPVARKSLGCLLEQRLLAGKRQQMFWKLLSRHGPKPGSSTSTEDDGAYDSQSP
jgi:hypothetical protein